MTSATIASTARHIFVIGLFAVLSVASTWPVWLHPTEAIPGGPGDNLLFLWNIWQTQSSLEAGRNPVYTDQVFFPHRQPIVLHTNALVHASLFYPLRNLLGLVGTYNLWVLTSLIVGAWGAFLLAHEVIGDSRAAIVASFIFTFSPFRMAHLAGHMMLVSAHWLPFYVLFLLRVRTGRWWHGVLAGLFGGLTLWTDLHYTLYLTLQTLATVASWVWARKRVPLEGAGLRLMVLVLTVAAFAVPFATAAWEAGLPLYGSEPSLVPDKSTVRFLSARLKDFVRPPWLHPLWGRSGHWDIEHQLYIGYAVLGLALCAVTPGFRARGPALYWFSTSALLVVLALGPVYPVHFGGQRHNVPMPYLVLAHLPGANLAQCPARFMGLAMLTIGVLAGLGFHRLLQSQYRWLAAVVAFGLLLEYVPAPYPVTRDSAPATLRELASRGGSVIDLPFHAGSPLRYSGRIDHRIPLYQTAHGLPRVGGWLSRCRDSYRHELLAEPVLGSLLRLCQGEDISQHQRERDQSLVGAVITAYSIRHVLIQPREVGQAPHHYLRELFPAAREHPLEDGGVWMELPKEITSGGSSR